MKAKLLFTALLGFIGLSAFAQKSMPTPKPRPADFEYYSAPDSTGKRTFLKTAASKTERTETYQLQLPYPIIFIHGLNSDADTWLTTTDSMTSQYGLQNGGRFDYCLNYNYIDYSNYSNPNTNFYPTADADIALFTGTHIAGDYYYVNFDVGTDGSYDPSTLITPPYVESNEAAIVKQGVALSNAIDWVLYLTGRDKVILMGHSMGGLAAREYLQNPNLWQPDGQHHVAKLVTTGTPHGGSNAEADVLVDFMIGIDAQSEACRDLRTSYDVSNSMGVYLFGGTESYSIMDNSNSEPYYNLDVNCDGNVGEVVTGLDQMDIYTDLDYACIIGICTDCEFGECLPGDGVVNDTSANLNTYYPGITTNVFYDYASTLLFTEIHTDEPGMFNLNMQGLDEPEFYNLAYHIGFDTTYTGFMTVPATTDVLYPYDFDEYTFSVPASGNVSVSVNNIIIALDFWVNIVNSSYQKVDSAFHSSGSLYNINFTTQLDAGDYYLEIIGLPEASSYLTPYNYTLSFSPCQPPAEPVSVYGTSPVCENSLQTYYVNPVSGATSYTWSLPFDWSGTSISNSITVTVGSTTGDVCVTANNDCGSSNQTCGAVTVNPLPTIPTISGNISICSGQSTTLSVSNPCSGCTYNWSNGKTGLSISVTTAGTITATATNGCGTSSNSNSLTIVVNSALSTLGNVSGTATVCQNSTQTYSVNPLSGATSYTWTLPSGWSGSSTTNSITATVGSSAGNVCVTANNGCGSSNQSCMAITINSAPMIPIISGNASICSGNSTTLSVSNSCNGCTYNWSNSMTGQSISVNTAGSITATATNGCGTSANSNTLTIVVNTVPPNVGSVIGNVTACQNSAQTYTVVVISNATSYTWALPTQWSGSSNNNSITATVDSVSGNVCVTASNGCGSSNQSCLTVNVNLGCVALQSDQSLVAAGGEAAGSGGTMSYSIGQVAYTWITGSNGSMNQGIQQPYDVLILGGASNDITLGSSAYPNPANAFVNLKVDRENFDNLSFQLYDLSGKLISNQKIYGTITSISMETLTNAAYILNVTDNGTIIKSFKIIKTK